MSLFHGRVLNNPAPGSWHHVDETALAMVIVLAVVLVMMAGVFALPVFRRRHDPCPEEEPKGSDLDASAIVLASKPQIIETPENESWRSDDPDTGMVESTDTIEENQATALWRNSTIPIWVRVLYPPILILIFIAIVVAQTVDVIDVEAKVIVVGIFQIPSLTIQSFNIVTFAKLLLDAGSTLLAVVIICASLVWPYLKLAMLTICWFFPTNWLAFKKRGHILHMIDSTGKWSLVEVFLLALTISYLDMTIKMVVLKINIEIDVVLHPRANLYFFTVALAASIVLSNIATVHHNRLEEARAVREAATKLKESHGVPPRNQLFPSVFPRFGKYTVPTLFAILILTAFAVLMVAGVVECVNYQIKGLAGLIIRSGPNPAPDYNMSLFELLGQPISQGNGALTFFTLFIILVAVIMPCIQLATSFYLCLPTTKLSLQNALTWRAVHNTISAWEALEVYIATVCVAVLEIDYITKLLLAPDLGLLNPIFDLLLKMFPQNQFIKELVSEGALTVVFRLEPVSWWLIGAVVLNSFARIFARYTIDRFIAQRTSKPSSEEFKKLDALERT